MFQKSKGCEKSCDIVGGIILEGSRKNMNIEIEGFLYLNILNFTLNLVMQKSKQT
jgi:hypothetical protein